MLDRAVVERTHLDLQRAGSHQPQRSPRALASSATGMSFLLRLTAVCWVPCVRTLTNLHYNQAEQG